MPERIAVIDIGSNSIKILVVRRAAGGALESLTVRTLDARISSGISRTLPRLSEEGMKRGRAAVLELLEDARKHSVEQTFLVATSAVRDAENGPDFCARIQDACGLTVRVLSGHEEANLIGRGLRCDPSLRSLTDFSLFDLGGGSMECLSFREGRIIQAVSLALGCVRLAEKCIPDLTGPFDEDARKRVAELTMEVMAKSGFHFVVRDSGVAVATGGTVATARAVLGSRNGKSFEESASLLKVSELRELLAWTGSMNLADRKCIPGMPPGRADVFPTALATLLAVAELGGIRAYQNSLYNLRWGVAAEALQ